jgi:hypothetical protein
MRKIFHRFFAIILIVGSVLLFADYASACSCITTPLDYQIKDSTDIVILRLKSIEKYKSEENYVRIKQSNLIVRKVYKGKLRVGQELNFNQGGGADCIWDFSEKEVGESFLFFLNQKKIMLSSSRKKGFWEAHICSRSASLKFSASDLLYLEKIREVNGKTRLSGTVTKIVYSEKNEPLSLRLAGIEVRIVGNGKDITVKTNKDGIYEVYNLPIGRYKVIPQKLDGYRLYQAESGFEVEIKAKSLEEQDIEYLVD